MGHDLKNSPGFLIDRNAHLLRQRVKARVAELGLGLTTEEVAILAALNHEDGLRIGDLAAQMVRDTTTVTRQVEGLERKKCVKREADKEDRRVVKVKLLKEGRRCFEVFDPALMEMKGAVFSGISEKEQELLLKCLRKMKSNLTST